jgi:hypothetical protein
MTTNAPVIDLSFGNEIAMVVQMLDYCKNRIDDLIGVSQQRRGDIGTRETATGIQTAVQNSAIQTLDWFILHDQFKKRGLKLWIEAAKVAWGGKSIKRQFFLDDGSIDMLDMDEKMTASFAEGEYGIDISTSVSDQEMINTLKQYGMAYLQNNGEMSTIMKIYRTKNPSALQKEIEKVEQRKAQEAQQAQESQQQAQQQLAQMQQQVEQAKLELENRKLDMEQERMDRDDMNQQLDRENKIYLAEISAMAFDTEKDINDNGIPDVLEQGKLALENTKTSYEHAFKNKDLESKKEIETKKIALEEKKIEATKELQKQKDKAAMEREQLKAKTAIKNKVSGQK